MIIKKNYKRISIVLTWFITYIILLIIPVFFSIVIFTQASGLIQEGINSEYKKELKQFQQSIDNKLDGIQKIIYKIAWDDKVNSLVNYIGPIEPIHTFMISKIVQDIKYQQTLDNFIADFFIYFKNNHFILDNKGKQDADEYYNLYIKNEDISYEQWSDLITQNHLQRFVNVGYENNTKNGITYCVHSLPFGTFGEPTANIIIRLNKEEILNENNTLQWISDINIMIINSSDEIIVTTQSNPFENPLYYIELENSADVFYKKLNGDKVVLLQAQSSIADWKYVFTIPMGVFLQRILYLKKLALFYAFLYIIIGAYLAYRFTKKNYKPIMSMMNLIVSKLGSKIDKININNEYDFIQNVMLKIINENEKSEKQLQENKEIMRKYFLTCLIKGKMLKRKSVEEVAKFYNIYFETKLFQVVLFQFDDSSVTVDKTENREYHKIAQSELENILRKNMGKEYVFYFIELDDKLCCLINVHEPKSKEENNKKITQTLQIVIRTILENMGIGLSIAVSGIHEGYDKISEAYFEAEQTMEYTILLGNNQIIHYEEILDYSKSNHTQFYSIESQKKFINAIRTRNFEKAAILINNILDEIFAKKLSVDMAKCLMFAVINTMLNVMDLVNIRTGDSFWDELNIFERLTACKTVQDMKSEMCDILKKVEQCVISKESENNSDKFTLIKQYIEENYNDQDLSVFRIAEEFNINQSYLSRVFKEHEGVGLLEYIAKVRINKAKELLENETISIKDIAQTIGFYNSNSFIRVFKKYEGITPGQYRDLNSVL